jgi:hypothetical protein
MNLLKYLGYGWVILVAAIIANRAAGLVNAVTWYDYIGNISRLGLKTATLSLHPLNVLFLFVLYPGIFGLIVYFAVLRN